MVQERGPWRAAAALAVALGVAMAAVGGGYRALLPRTLAGADLEVASALDAVCVELCFVVGPAVAAAAAWFAGAPGVFATVTACAALGAAATRRRSLGRVSIALLGTFGLLTLPVAVAPVAVVAVLVGGAPFALMATAGSLIIQRAVPEGRAAEAFSLLNAAILTGAAAGNALVSLRIASAGVRATLATAGAAQVLVAAGLAAVTAARGRRPAAVAPGPEAVTAGR
jgi:hypothetical protein